MASRRDEKNRRIGEDMRLYYMEELHVYEQAEGGNQLDKLLNRGDMGGDGESCARGAGIVGAVRAGEFFVALVFSVFLGNDLSAWIRMERPANHLS
jgi:hypothetical protein